MDLYQAIIGGLKTSLIIGLFYGIGTIGLSLIYRYLKFPDFSTVVSIIVGSLISVQITNLIGSPFGVLFGILAGIVMGAIIGLVTGLQIVYAKIPPILAGIITYTSAKSLAFFITGNNAELFYNSNLDKGLDYFISNVFSFQTLIISIIFCLLVSFLVSRIFRTRFGLMILALLGTDNFIKYRHKENGKTTIYLIMLGNAIIGFGGALASIQNRSATVDNHNEFIFIALGGYALGMYLIKLLSKPKIQKYLDKDNKTSAPFWIRILIFYIGYLSYNDENPSKLFTTFLLFILSSALINVIFMTVNNEIPSNYGYLAKALILFVFIGLSNISDAIAKKG